MSAILGSMSALPCYHQSSFNFWFGHHSAATRITSDLAQVKYGDNPLARIRRSVRNSALSPVLSLGINSFRAHVNITK
jgi:hypothetical protein